MGTLYIVATPIGNLGDISLRALETLKEVDFVLAEDTRVTRKLLSHYNIQTPLISYHQHSKDRVAENVFQLLSQGKNLALATDAGTPGISDPGNELVKCLLVRSGGDEKKERDGTRLAQLRQSRTTTARIIPIPGPSALTTLASVAGVPMDKFLFLGYPPAKKGRTKFFQEIGESRHPVIFYESPHRILRTLQELQSTNYNLQTIVGRELTKKFEKIYRGAVAEVLEELSQEKIQGEFAVVISPFGRIG